MASHLTSGRINLGILRESYRRELLECLDKCIGSKVKYSTFRLPSKSVHFKVLFAIAAFNVTDFFKVKLM